jgi:3-hydroxybutyryl-CoA dehydratase
MVVDFSNLTGDKNPIHLDDDYAKKTIFGRTIVHGMLLSGFISKIIAEKYPGEGSIYLKQILNFKNPCFVDDVISVNVELKEKIQNKFYLKTTILRDDVVIIDGDAIVLNQNKIN